MRKPVIGDIEEGLDIKQGLMRSLENLFMLNSTEHEI